MVIDLGTGTGQAVLRRAGHEPDTLVIGVDSDAAALRDASHRAARGRVRGLANAMFVVEAAEALPGPLEARADLVTVALPWGSLLRGLLTADPALVESTSALLRDGGELELLLSTMPADGPMPELDAAGAARLAQGYSRLGLQSVEIRPATAEDVARLSSAWGRRLGIPDRRPGLLLRLARRRA